jgi:hypothetical protein
VPREVLDQLDVRLVDTVDEAVEAALEPAAPAPTARAA